MDAHVMKDDLHRYLRTAREAVLWKLDGLSERDVRRPMTRTGTNLLGLVKHLAAVELGYGENMPGGMDDAAWAAHRDRLEQVARGFTGS